MAETSDISANSDERSAQEILHAVLVKHGLNAAPMGDLFKSLKTPATIGEVVALRYDILDLFLTIAEIMGQDDQEDRGTRLANFGTDLRKFHDEARLLVAKGIESSAIHALAEPEA